MSCVYTSTSATPAHRMLQRPLQVQCQHQNAYFEHWKERICQTNIQPLTHDKKTAVSQRQNDHAKLSTCILTHQTGRPVSTTALPISESPCASCPMASAAAFRTLSCGDFSSAVRGGKMPAILASANVQWTCNRNMHTAVAAACHKSYM